MELSENEVRGVTLVVKALSNKFRFIDGWQSNEYSDKYDVVLFIDLIVNPQKFIKYYNLSEENIDERIYGKFKETTLFSLTRFALPWGDEEIKKLWDEKFDFFYEEKKIMDRELEEFYDMIPESLQKKNKFELPISISVSHFVSP